MTDYSADFAQTLTEIYTILPTAIWQEWFAADQLAALLPDVGSNGVTPLLEALCVTETDERIILGIPIDTPAWNDYHHRREILTAIGSAIAEKGVCLIGLRLCSEAWMRQFTREEAEAYDPDTQRLGAFPDREEIMLVAGMTLDGRVSAAHAILHRDADEKFTGIDAWDVQHAMGGEQDDPQIELLRVVFEAFAVRMLKKYGGKEEK